MLEQNFIFYIYLINNYMIFSFMVIFFSFLTLIFNYDNIIIMFFSIEIIIFGCITNFIIFSLFSFNYSGFIYALLLLIVSVSELCIGLSIVIKYEKGLKKFYLNKMAF